ncbi:MAG: peptide MFS transporter [Candidatus Saccharicenans sp.]|uniref:peptide MFS transporter n=1 Tax=Candidatus Saccharicenans sp. TaxID=2819258 RepID=UPI00404960C0
MLKQHPRALSYIFFTEMWERIGFYTLMAILVLYMDRVLGWSDSRKGDWYGLFLGLCYFFPLVGGWLGDRVFGRLKTVQAGAVLMALGYVGLALSSASQTITFSLGLLLVAIGTGIFKVNMSVLVGNIYQDRPQLRDAGFNIYYMGVNLGAMIAPLIATFNNAVFNSYHLSFWVAAVGLILALIIFQTGQPHLALADDLKQKKTSQIKPESRPSPQSSSPERENPLSTGDNKPETDISGRVLSLIILFAIVILFWVAFYQNGFALTLFAARSTVIKKWLRPETYQFFEPFFILVLTPILLLILDLLRQRGKEPSTPRKIFLGMLFMTAAMFIMVIACLRGGNQDQNIMSPLWLIKTYFVVTIAEILISPMGLSYVSKVAPANISGLMMGGWYLAISLGSYGSGLVGKFYSHLAHHQFFLLLAALLALAALLVGLSIRQLERYSD